MLQPRRAFLLPLLAALLSFTSPTHAQTSTKPIGPNPDNTVTGRIDYVALGASFRATNGNTNACAVKSNTTGSVGGVYTGTENWWVAQREVNGINAVVNAGDRTAAQRVPAGTAVRAAYLYWFASKATNTAPDTTVTFTVDGTPHTVTANRTWTGTFDNADLGAFADVTPLVAATPNATMRMDDLNIQVNSVNCDVATVHGSWALYIIYEHPGLSSKKISIYDGLNYVYNSAAQVTAAGLAVPDASGLDTISKVTVTATEGDPAGSSGSDVLELQAGNGARTPLSSSNRPVTDLYRGLVSSQDGAGVETVQSGSNVTGATTTGGLDIATFNVTGLTPAGTSSLNAYVASNAGEQVNLYSLVVMANTTNPNVRVRKTLDGSGTAGVGESVNFLLTVDNRQGVTEALNVVTVDTLPRGLTFTGAQLSYDGGVTWAAVTGVTSSVHPTTGVTTVTLPPVRRLDPSGEVWGGTGAIATRLGTQDVRYRITTRADGRVLGTLTNTATVRSGSAEPAAHLADNTSQQAVTVSVPTPDLTLAISGPDLASPSTAAGTDPPTTAVHRFVAYTLTVTSTNAVASGQTTVSTTLPAGLSWSGGFTAAPASWTCSSSGQTVTCTTTAMINPGGPHTLTLQNVRVAPGTAAGPAFTVLAKVTNAQETAADAGRGNAAGVTTRLILARLTKQVRNVTADSRGNAGVPRFGSRSEGTPGQVLEYCILAENPGGVDLANFVIRDALEGTVMALLNVTADPAYGGQAVRYTRTLPGEPATSGAYTAAAGDDAGTLSTALEVGVGTLRVSETVQVCFQAGIR